MTNKVQSKRNTHPTWDCIKSKDISVATALSKIWRSKMMIGRIEFLLKQSIVFFLVSCRLHAQIISTGIMTGSSTTGLYATS